MFLPKLLALLISFFGGIVVNHWIARRVFATTNELKEREILLHGLLISIIINGVLGTYLAALKIFNLYVFAAIFITLILFLRRDLYITLKTIVESIHELYQNLRGLNVLTIVATCSISALFTILTMLCRVPTQNPDAWVFHLPIAASIIEHSGFIYPIIDHIHYANQPSFMSVLFAQMMSLEPNFSLAAFVNVLLYLFMFIALASVWNNFGRALCILLVFVAANLSFATGAPTPLTDLSRSCLSVLGLTYLALYRDRSIAYYAGLAAICIGASIAAKYTELMSLSIMALMLASEFKARAGRRLILKCALIITFIASFWYIKNLILFKNPIYPFIFGHPGLSDIWMRDYMQEMTTAFDPAHRHFVHDLFTRQGWFDFFSVTWVWFFQESFVAKLCLFLCLLGSIIYPRLIIPMFGSTIFLFIFWYAVMFNHIRWAKPAYLLLYITACYALIMFMDDFCKNRLLKSLNLFKLELYKHKLSFAAALGLASIGLLFVFNSRPPVVEKINIQWPTIKIIELITSVVKPNGLEQFMMKNREGYLIYQYIVRNNLMQVFQPYHPDHKLYTKVYNNNTAGNWFIDDEQLLLETPEAFIKKNHIEYFVLRTQFSDVDLERIGSTKMVQANSVTSILKKEAKILLEDDRGWQLYKVGPHSSIK